MFKRNGKASIIALILALALAACGDNTATSTTAASTTAPAAATTASGGAATTAPAGTTAAAGGATTAAGGATTAAGTSAATGTTAAGTSAASGTTATGTSAATTAPATTAAASGAATTVPPTPTLPAAQAGITPNTSITGTIRIAIQSSSPQETALVNQQLANFFAAYPQIKVTVETITDAAKLNTELASGDPPDVFYVDSLVAPDRIADKLVLPLDDLAKKYNVNFSDYQDNLVKAYTGPDGKHYGLPKDFNTLGMVYNTKFLSDAGITTPPTTYDELKTALQKIKDAGKLPAQAAPFVVDPDMARILPYFYAQGGNVLSSDSKSSTITQGDAFKNTLQYFVDLRKAGLAKKSSEVGADWSGDAMSKGLAAVVFEGGWVNPTMKTSPNAGNYAIAELPKGTGQGNLIFTVAYSVAAKSKSPDAAFALASYLTGQASEDLTAKSGLAIPSRKAQTDVAVQQFPKEFKAIAAGVAYARPWQFGVGFGVFGDKANPILQKVWGDNNVADAPSQIDKAIKGILDANQ